jgi:hypothetical protein
MAAFDLWLSEVFRPNVVSKPVHGYLVPANVAKRFQVTSSGTTLYTEIRIEFRDTVGSRSQGQSC